MKTRQPLMFLFFLVLQVNFGDGRGWTYPLLTQDQHPRVHLFDSLQGRGPGRLSAQSQTAFPRDQVDLPLVKYLRRHQNGEANLFNNMEDLDVIDGESAKYTHDRRCLAA